MSTAAQGRAEIERIGRLQRWLAEQGLDALLVGQLLDVRYMTGYTGTHGVALVVSEAARERLGPHRFITDFRYRTQAAAEVPAVYEREIATGEALEALAKELAGEGGRLAFDEAQLSVRAHRRLGELLGEGWELVATAGAVARLRAVKDAGEIGRIRAAAELADEAMRGLLEAGLTGRTEREAALELELRMRRLGARDASFPTIVAAGAHAALPHAQPRDEPIPADALVTVDWGARHEGYCSDCTRTYATGERLPGGAREVYELVRSAQAAGVEAVRPGPTGREVDAAARAIIDAAGHGGEFGHGLGHGVGLDVHEPPRLSRTGGDERLQAGNVVTVEPGVYIPGELGVRIEDLVVVTEDGHDVLSALPRELTLIA